MSAAREASPGGSLQPRMRRDRHDADAQRPASRQMCEDLEATNDVSRQPQHARECL